MYRSILFLFLIQFTYGQQNYKIDSLNYIKDSISYKSCIRTALSYFKERQLDSFKKYSIKSYLLSKKINSPRKTQKAHFYLATYYKYKEMSDSAYYHYHKSKSILLKLKDTITAGRRLFSIARIQLREKDLLGSEISSITALEYVESSNLYRIKHQIINNLALTLQEKGAPYEALKFYDISLKELRKDSLENTPLKLNIINNKGLVYQSINQQGKAISYFKKGLSYDSIKEKYPIKYALLLENLASSNFLLGKNKGVLNQYYEVLAIRKKLKILKGISTTHLNIADYYKRFNQQQKALFHAKKGLLYARKTDNNKRLLEALKLLSELTTDKQSTQYLRQYIQLNDSLFQKERTLKNQFAKIRYQTDKKEKENNILKSENEKKQVEITYQKQQKTIGWLIAILSLFTLGISISLFIVRRKKMIYQTQLEKAQIRERERQQIAKSLHDEVAGDLFLLHQKLEKTNQPELAQKLSIVKSNVRNLSHQLSSISFDKVSFEDQVINLITDYFEPNFKIFPTGLLDHDWANINEPTKRVLYLSTRECIQNSKKYAKASKVVVHFSTCKKSVHLNISDDGIGFDIRTSKKGIGLQNLQERVEELGGSLLVKSKIDNGTQISIRIPLNV
ncbi:putative transmembrane protein. putative two-component system-sensor histidine kinase [Tenacibaculum maritimum]|uniref:tetratricopeptide repeat-containing sensor histidine kinase n=1 Tax=Tenacibaculum maritimum TaxID=107401 RepID=UPI0012E454B5|nr:tetratricopeptide repeat-containing sensor histidine kinase [Tenacibaculum maritimum]CAA0203911.1 putative transmembrane protein. putative two-component system-sensor histidine kinase [Tenacibaculum maritimum]